MYRQSSHPSVQYSQAVLSAALESLLREQPLEDIRISDLCLRADVSRNSYYNNFDSITDVLEYLIDRYLLPLYNELDQTQYESDQLLLRFFSYWYENRRFLTTLYQQNLYSIFAKKLLSISLERTRYPFPPGEHPDPQRELMNGCVVGGLCSMLQIWTEHGFSVPPEIIYRISRQCMLTRAGSAEAYSLPESDSLKGIREVTQKKKCPAIGE